MKDAYKPSECESLKKQNTNLPKFNVFNEKILGSSESHREYKN